MSNSTAPHPLERRAGARKPMVLPVRLAVISAGTNKEKTLSSVAATCYGVIYDISTTGMQIEVTGVVAKHFLSDEGLTGMVQIGFMHRELRRMGDVLGKVAWSKAATQRGACILGVKLDNPLAEDDVDLVARYGPLEPKPERSIIWLVAALIVAALGVGGMILARHDASRSDELAMTSAKESDSRGQRLAECRAALDRSNMLLHAAEEGSEHDEAKPHDAHDAPDAGARPREGIGDAAVTEVADGGI